MKGKFLLVLLILVFALAANVYGQTSPLVGHWEYWGGDYIYFFWDSSEIAFLSNGVVLNRDDDESGRWSVIGSGRLRVVDDYGDTYNFTFEIIDSMLTIIDEDGDVGRWKRLR
jgi:hypothetical protein